MATYLGTNILYLRKLKKVNQRIVAALVNKGPTTIGNWEAGKSEPSIRELNILAVYFKVSLDELINTDLSNSNLHITRLSDKKAIPHLTADDTYDQECATMVIQAQRISIETLQRALKLAEEQIGLLKTIIPDYIPK